MSSLEFLAKKVMPQLSILLAMVLASGYSVNEFGGMIAWTMFIFSAVCFHVGGEHFKHVYACFLEDRAVAKASVVETAEVIEIAAFRKAA